MKIELEDVGKRYRREWVIRHFDYTFNAGQAYAVSGPNGSGKSTLLRILAGHLTPSRGRIRFSENDRNIPASEVYLRLNLTGPYIELIEEFTLDEAIDFHLRFKPLLPGIDRASFPELLQLDRARSKPVRDFSSGMRQRLKLGLSICTRSELLLLDEPTATLDADGARWFNQLLETWRPGRLLIVASNVEEDFRSCTERIYLPDFR